MQATFSTKNTDYLDLTCNIALRKCAELPLRPDKNDPEYGVQTREKVGNVGFGRVAKNTLHLNNQQPVENAACRSATRLHFQYCPSLVRIFPEEHLLQVIVCFRIRKHAEITLMTAIYDNPSPSETRWLHCSFPHPGTTFVTTIPKDKLHHLVLSFAAEFHLCFSFASNASRFNFSQNVNFDDLPLLLFCPETKQSSELSPKTTSSRIAPWLLSGVLHSLSVLDVTQHKSTYVFLADDFN